MVVLAVMRSAALCGGGCVKTSIPPASAAWYFSFSLEVLRSTNLLDTTDFSRVEFQFRPSSTVQVRLKMKYHTTKVGGI